MRRSILHALIPIIVVLAAFGYVPAVQAQSVLVDGQIIKIDESAKKITIRHFGAACFQIGHRFLGLGEWKDAVDDDFKLVGVDERGQEGQVGTARVHEQVATGSHAGFHASAN
jgi:hypothetical protein